MGGCESGVLTFPLEFKLLADTEAVTAGRWACKVVGFQPNILESLHDPMILGKEAKETAPPFSKCQHGTRGGRSNLWTLVIWQLLTLSVSPRLSTAVRSMPAGWNYYSTGQNPQPGCLYQHMGHLLLQSPLVNFLSLPLQCEGHYKDRALGTGSYSIKNPSINEVSSLSP